MTAMSFQPELGILHSVIKRVNVTHSGNRESLFTFSYLLKKEVR